MREFRSVMAAVAACVVLVGCVSSDRPSADVTNAPVGAGVNVQGGSAEDFIVNVGRRIFFSENSDDLDDTARATLDKQAEFLKSYPRYKVKIEGYADEKGTADFNTKLGLRRAEAARSYLIVQGIQPTRMRVKSLGNTVKVQNCDDISCWSQNRRVITKLEGDS